MSHLIRSFITASKRYPRERQTPKSSPVVHQKLTASIRDVRLSVIDLLDSKALRDRDYQITQLVARLGKYEDSRLAIAQPLKTSDLTGAFEDIPSAPCYIPSYESPRIPELPPHYATFQTETNVWYEATTNTPFLLHKDLDRALLAELGKWCYDNNIRCPRAEPMGVPGAAVDGKKQKAIGSLDFWVLPADPHHLEKFEVGLYRILGGLAERLGYDVPLVRFFIRPPPVCVDPDEDLDDDRNI